MATLTISLPDRLKHWVDQQANGGLFDGPGDYVRDLIRREHERAARIAAMQRLVDEGRASGPSSDNMDAIRSRVLAHRPEREPARSA